MTETPAVGIVPSYVQDAWWTPGDDPDATVVRDASTGEAIARVSTAGLDLAAALEHARTVGQRSLGELTFHRRAVLLKQFAVVLSEHKEELYALSMHACSTRRDSLSDIDGGIGVLFTYSSKGLRELPNAQVYLDGAVEPLSKDGSFSGRHVYTRLPGVAVQINAFNFPMWGALEKFAPAFLAGVPSVIKPATPTAYIAEAWVRILVDPDPGPVLANYGLENLRFITPVSPGDDIRVRLTAKQIAPRETDEYGEVRWDAEIRNQRDEIVAQYDVLTLVAKE